MGEPPAESALLVPWKKVMLNSRKLRVWGGNKARRGKGEDKGQCWSKGVERPHVLLQGRETKKLLRIPVGNAFQLPIIDQVALSEFFNEGLGLLVLGKWVVDAEHDLFNGRNTQQTGHWSQ